MHCPRKIYYTLHSGKNSKPAYYIRSYAAIFTPRFVLRALLRRDLRALAGHPDEAYIEERASYYCRLAPGVPFDSDRFAAESVALSDQKVTGQKVYYLDSYRYAKAFDPSLRWLLLPGDIVHVPALPSITKSRPLTSDNANSVLMKLDRVRHFLFVNDRKPFAAKKDKVIFRGLIGQDGGTDLKQNRYNFVTRYFGHPMCDVGVIDRQYPEWRTEKMTIGEHLDYKFIMALEGNDVASNLKWVMSSNSVAVMPRPTCETWFMEGRLKPDYHYIEIKPDFSDLEERIRYYIAHPDEAEAIIRHAHDYVAQFRDSRRERLISLLVLKKYFDFTNKRQPTP